ncbi:hypothetical protein KP509_26G006200 [Ceratopteris richardii]|nr:hypothetical protein KP509_26G006200 [Ceratopteris richardii]
MEGQGFAPNLITFTFSFKACACIRALEQGSELHSNMLERGLPLDHIVITALVDMYAKCGALVKAQEAFDACFTHDVATWNALIAGYVQNECCEEALLCFEKMQTGGISPNAITLACVLRACSLVKAVEKGKEIHAEVVQNGLLKADPFIGSAVVDMYAKCGALSKAKEVLKVLPERDVVVWNSLIVGYVLHDYNEEALFCFDQMQAEGVSPNMVTYACSVNACGNIGALEKGSEIHADASRKALLELDLSIGSALVDMYAKCGELSKAQGVFEKLLNRTVVTWNALITGYAQIGDVENVHLMFDKLVVDDKDPQPVTFVGILCACSHSGLVDIGLKCFILMISDFSIIPTPTHYNCMIDLLGRAGQLESAVYFLGRGPFHPTIEMWLSLLSACRKWGNIDLGRQIFEQAIFLDESEGAAYFCMYNIYADSGLLDDAKRIETMRVKKQAWNKHKDYGMFRMDESALH